MEKPALFAVVSLKKNKKPVVSLACIKLVEVSNHKKAFSGLKSENSSSQGRPNRQTEESSPLQLANPMRILFNSLRQSR